MKEPLFFYEDQSEWTDLGGGTKRSIKGYDDRIMLVKAAFEKGAVGAAHSHPHSQSSMIESGVFEVTIGEEKAILKTGDCFFVPSAVEHGVVALEAGVILDVFAPAREDFLK